MAIHPKWIGAVLQLVTILQLLTVVAAIDLEQRTMVTHLWEVGVDTMTNTPPDTLVESPIFVSYNGSRTESWYLRVYPKGYASDKGLVSIYLVYISDPPLETTPKVEVFIDNKEEIDVLRKWSSNTYDRLEESSGWGDFARPEILLDPNNGFIFDGKIRFGARIASDHRILDESENAEITYVWGIGAQNMELRGDVFLESPKFNTFRISEKQGKVVEESWHIRVYPQGTAVMNETDTSPKNIGMYLVYSGDAPVSPVVAYLILNKKPENIIRYWATKTFQNNGDSRGYNDLISKTRLLDPSQGFVDKDGLILFAVRVPTSYAKPKVENAVAVTTTWELGVDTIKNLALGVSVESPKFSNINGTVEEEWFLRVYPNGYLDSNKGFMSVYLVNAKGAPTRADAEVVIMNDSEELAIRRWYRESYEAEAESNGYHRAASPAMLIDPSKGFIYDGDKVRFSVTMRSTPPPHKLKQKYATFIWEVSVKTMQNGGQHESPKYMVKGPYGQETWHLRLFPQGYTNENKGYVSLYLVYGGRYTSTPKAEVFLVNQKENDVIRKWSTSNFDHLGESIGFARFISVEHVMDPNKGFINNNRVKFGLRLPVESSKSTFGEDCPVCNYRCPPCRQLPPATTQPPPPLPVASGGSPAAPTAVTPAVAPAACPAAPANVDVTSDLSRGQTNSTKASVWKNVRLKVGNHELLVEEISTTQQLQSLLSSLTRETGVSVKQGQDSPLEIICKDMK